MENMILRSVFEASWRRHEPYPTVAILVEDLWRQRVAFFRQLVPGDVAVHPEPLLLQHGDVYLLEADSIGLQETYYCLLVLLYLEVKDKKCKCRHFQPKPGEIQKDSAHCAEDSVLCLFCEDTAHN